MLQIPTSDQYTSLLNLESKAWLLCETVFAVVSDFELTKGGMYFKLFILEIFLMCTVLSIYVLRTSQTNENNAYVYTLPRL